MKKWAILVLVVLAGALLTMQYVAEKKKSSGLPGAVTAPVSEQAVGVALPQEASKSAGNQADNFVSQNTGGPLALYSIQSSYKGACEGGSLKEMLDSHDKYWGAFAKETPFNFADTQKMYAYMVDFVSCQAAARTDVTLCDSLPGAAEKLGVKVTLESSPSYTCRKKTTNLLFEAFQAGSVKGDAYCRVAMSYWDPADLARFSLPDFCEAVSKGPDNAAPFLLKAFAPAPPEAAAKIALDFPVREGDCKKNQECLTKFSLYTAAKKGRPADCPAEYKAQCQAIAARSTVPCDKLLQDMSKFYCTSVEKVKKLTGGYIGMSKEAIAEDIKKAKAAKTDADNMKKEQEKLQEDANKRVKEAVKKK